MNCLFFPSHEQMMSIASPSGQFGHKHGPYGTVLGRPLGIVSGGTCRARRGAARPTGKQFSDGAGTGLICRGCSTSAVAAGAGMPRKWARAAAAPRTVPCDGALSAPALAVTVPGISLPARRGGWVSRLDAGWRPLYDGFQQPSGPARAGPSPTTTIGGRAATNVSRFQV